MPATTRKTALFIQAEQLRMARRYGEAIPVFESILIEDPDDIAVRRTLAGLYLLEGDPKKALVGSMLLLTCLIAEGHVSQAEAMVEKIRALDAKGAFEERLATLAKQLDAAKASRPPAPAVEEVVEEQTVVVEETGTILIEEVEAPRHEERHVSPTDFVDLSEGELTEEDLAGIEAEVRRSAEDVSRSVARLSTTLFGRVPPEGLSELIRACEAVPFHRDSILAREGEASAAVIILAEGEVEGRARRSDDGERVAVGRFGPGEILGLMAFLTGDPQDLTIVAESDGLGYRLPHEELERLMAEHLTFGMAVLDLYRERVVGLYIKTSRVLSGLPAQAQAALVRSFELQNAFPDDVIIREATTGDDLYFIKKGTVKVVTERAGTGIELARMGKHEFFGEISFLTGKRRTASVVAVEPTELLRVKGERMVTIADEHPEVKSVLRDVQAQHAMEAAQRLRGWP